MDPVTRTPAEEAKRFRRAYWIHVSAVAGVVAIAYALFPTWRATLAREGGVLENFTAILFAIAVVLGVAAFLSPRSRGLTPRRGAILPGLALLALFDETSFFGLLAGADNPSSLPAGAHAPQRSPLRLGEGYIIDGVHDFFTLPFKFVRNVFGPWGIAAGATLLALVVALLIWKRRAYMPRLMAAVRAYPPFDYVRLAALFLIPAFLLDLWPAEMSVAALQLCEELFEALAALSMAFGAAAMLEPAVVRSAETNEPPDGPASGFGPQGP